MLVDVIYDSGVKLVWSGEAEPKDLFTDLFVEGRSNLKVIVESDDLTPCDTEYEQELTQRSREMDLCVEKGGSVTHIKHHSAVPEVGKIKCTENTEATFHVMKGETAAFKDLEFAVRRAISRLVEMGGKQYMQFGNK